MLVSPNFAFKRPISCFCANVVKRFENKSPLSPAVGSNSQHVRVNEIAGAGNAKRSVLSTASSSQSFSAVVGKAAFTDSRRGLTSLNEIRNSMADVVRLRALK